MTYVLGALRKAVWVKKHDMHPPGQTPFDADKNVALEKLGPLRPNIGVLFPDPDDPANKSRIVTLETMTPLPKWALSFVLKKMQPKNMASMIKAFRASRRYQEAMAALTPGR